MLQMRLYFVIVAEAK